MSPTELQNVESTIKSLTQQVLTVYYRAKATIDFVTKKGGLAGASAESINAYGALQQFVTLIENGVTAQGDYLETLTQNLSHPQV